MKKILFLVISLSFTFCYAQTASPELKIGGVKGQFVNTDELVLKGITCVKNDQRLISFCVTTEMNKVSKKFSSNGDQLSAEFIRYCQSLATGSKLRFDSISVKSKDKIQLLPSLSFLVKRETPQCNVGKFYNAYELSADDILAQPNLSCSPDFFNVISFDLLIASHEKLSRTMCKSAKFSAETINAIKQLKGGETVWFENIMAVSNSQDTTPMPPLKLAILGSSKDLPCTLNGISFGIWNREISKTELELKVPASDVEIQSFSFSALVNGKMISYRQSNGNKLTDEMKKLISQLLPGDVIKIENIKAERGGLGLKLNPIFLRISGKSPFSQAVIGNLSFGELTIDALDKNSKITVDGLEAVSFVVRTPEENMMKCEKGMLSSNQLEQIKMLPKGTVLQFYNIYYIAKGKRIKAEDIWVKIK